MAKEAAMHGMPYVCPIEVRYRDVDAMNHVNNAVHVTYLEVARVRLWHDRFDPLASARESPFLVARVAVDYRAPIGLGDDVAIGVGVSAIGRSSFTLAYRVEASGRLAAEASTVQVLVDPRTGRPRPIDDELRQRLLAIALVTSE
jgi:acyl-CoA thioester hydrolase